MNLNGIPIGSEDPTRLADYYRRLFGEPGWDDGGYTGWMLGSGGVTVGPHSDVHGLSESPGRIIWNIETEDVRADFERFRPPARRWSRSRTRWTARPTTRSSPPSPTRTETCSSS